MSVPKINPASSRIPSAGPSRTHLPEESWEASWPSGMQQLVSGAPILQQSVAFLGDSVGGDAAKVTTGVGAATAKAPRKVFPAPAPVPSPTPVPSPVPVTAPSSGVYAFEGAKWASPTITWSFAASTYAQDAATPFSPSYSPR